MYVVLTWLTLFL